MAGFDGRGPLGQGPMTGRGQGFCALTTSEENRSEVRGFAGINGSAVGQTKVNGSFSFGGKEVFNMPLGDRTGPAGMGPMTGRAAGFCAGYPVPGYMNPVVGRAGYYGVGAPVVGPYGAGYGVPYGGWGNLGFRRGFGFGFGRGFGRGRGWGRGRGGGRFGFRW